MIAAYFHTLARYNAWANQRVLAACAALPEAELTADRRAFFRSILGTLNHILVGDLLWLARIEGQPPPALALDALLHDNLAALAARREEQDARLLRLANGLTQVRLGGMLCYRNTKGVAMETPLAVVLGHLFNHQTHHRGQIHQMLGEAGVAPPELDLLYFPR